ncbi:MAG: hypothetical protein K9W44_04315 [Candidatus Lokiarchaeota archaeon]|nr:hypothetical protein [Candidatus Harpocratesius repetitus]
MICNFFVLRNGLPILNISLDPKYRLAENNNEFTLISGFFQAINSFADSVGNLGQIDEVQMTDLLFTFQRKNLDGQKNELLFILTTEGNPDKITRKIIMGEASSTFIHMFGKNLKKDWNGDIKPYHRFEKVFLDIVEKIQGNLPILENDAKNSANSNESKSLIYKMPEIRTTVPADAFSMAITKSSRFLNPSLEKSNETGTSYKQPTHGISRRFSQYQTLQYATNNLGKINNANTIGFSKQANMPTNNYSNLRELQKFSPNRFIPDNNSPIMHQSSQFGSNYYPANPFIKTHHQIEFPQNVHRNGTNQVYQDSILRMQQFPQRFYHKPIHELIPVKNHITAGVFRNQLQNSWIKVLMVAIDGRKTLRNLAELLDLPLGDIIQACQYLQQKNFIQFKN